jgi:hypothetical protein
MMMVDGGISSDRIPKRFMQGCTKPPTVMLEAVTVKAGAASPASHSALHLQAVSWFDRMATCFFVPTCHLVG